MKNTGLGVLENSTVETFTSNAGMKIRSKINPMWREILKEFTSRNVVLEQYPNLNDDEPYIFVVNHSFDEDVISSLDCIDRNAYVLNGSTDQTEHNPVFYALWLNGMIYVNRKCPDSRQSAIDKMERVLEHGNSTMLFAEGGYNNSENNFINPLFHSPYILSKKLGVKVVPVISFNDFGTDDIFVRFGDPIDLGKYEQYEASDILRDQMSSIIYEIILDHTEPIQRKKLLQYMRDSILKELIRRKKKNILKNILSCDKVENEAKSVFSRLPNEVRDYYMEMRKMVYECQKWYNDVWDEELTYYPGHNVTTPEQAREYIDNVKINANNAWVLAPTLVRREEDKHYDLKDYLRKNLVLTKGK